MTLSLEHLNCCMQVRFHAKRLSRTHQLSSANNRSAENSSFPLYSAKIAYAENLFASRERYKVTLAGIPVKCSQPHENASFPVSRGLCATRPRPGRSAIPVVGDPFERYYQSGKHFPSQTTGPLSGAQRKTPAAERRYPLVFGSALSAFCMARCLV